MAQQIDVPTRAMLTGVTFVSNDVGLAVGHDSVILRTTDGGNTWDMVFSAPEDEAPFFDVWFADANNGVAIGMLLLGIALVLSGRFGGEMRSNPLNQRGHFPLRSSSEMLSRRKFRSDTPG